MNSFRFLTAGESHGCALTAIVDGMPAGLRLDEESLNADLARRQKGYGRGGRMRIESDRAQIISGVRFGETTGAPVTVLIQNKDWENWTDRMSAFGPRAGEAVTALRPGHADAAGAAKYAREDVRDILERSSARETAARVAIGALAKALLAACGIAVSSEVVELGGVKTDPAKRREGFFDTELNCRDGEAAAMMRKKIDEAKAAGDTLGGVFEVVVTGAPVGLGSHIQWDRRLDGRLAGAMMSIQAIKGVEIGAGFLTARLPGSEVHDEMFTDENGGIMRHTNRAGGLEGGMTNGEPIVIRAAMKPIPTLMKPLRSVDLKTREAVLASKERSDVCAVPAASVVGEAMAAIVVADALLEKFGDGALCDIIADMTAYKKRLASL